ncbi:hypothetical protein [Tsukamurella soli]|uniref:hypothetical protein n=1 Tax=Tsukamurella soli TaxID=644556 RepID=UPI0031EF35C9
MNRRCAVAWVCAFLAFVGAGTFYFHGATGLDGLFVVIALACVLVAIQLHRTEFRR